MAFFASLRASRSSSSSASGTHHEFPTVFECRTSDDGSFFSGHRHNNENNNDNDDDNDDDNDGSGGIPREKQTIVSDLDGTLLRSPTSFPYFMLMAFESPFGLLRFTLLLLLSPLAWLIYQFASEAAAINMLIFVTFAGVREADIVSAARAVLPKFYVQDVHPDAWRVFSSTFGRRLVLTANPRVMVEPFALQYLGADAVVGTELHYFPGKARRASGLVLRPGVMVGPVKAHALKRYLGDVSPDVGLGDSTSDHPFLRQCKEGYIVPRLPKVDALPPSKLPKTLIFHDGRLVKKPTALWALLTLIWLPMGFLLAIIRMATGILLPMSIVYYGFWILGVRVVVKGIPPISVKDGSKHGVLFVCTHRTLLDPIFVSCAVKRPVSALTYSLSRLSEILSPIPTVRLSRNREKDSSNICKLLKQGDLVICPEGTTCREPFLLRFSALFAELTDYIIPVATNCHMGMFNATSARGWKALDSFCFFMNPSPVYEITFLNELPPELTCGGGKSSYEVANYIQRTLAATLNFECTNFTRKDKYLALAGHDGNVSSGKRVHK